MLPKISIQQPLERVRYHDCSSVPRMSCQTSTSKMQANPGPGLIATTLLMLAAAFAIACSTCWRRVFCATRVDRHADSTQWRFQFVRDQGRSSLCYCLDAICWSSPPASVPRSTTKNCGGLQGAPKGDRHRCTHRMQSLLATRLRRVFSRRSSIGEYKGPTA